MGYSRSIHAVKRVEPFLKQLLETEETIEFLSDDPSRHAYQLREGIYSARIRALTPDKQPNEPYYSYAQLDRKFIFKTVAGRVICQPRDLVPVIRLQQTHNTMVLRDITEELGIIGAAITHGAEKIHFPDAEPDSVDLESVYNWASQAGYYIIAGDNGVVLTKNDPGVIAWKPEN